MEEEIDLRPYVETLLNNWKWIVGIGVLFAALAIIVTIATPDSYEASALVAVLEPSQEVQFDPRFSNLEKRDTLLKAYPEIARSDELVQSLLEQVDVAGVMTLPQLQQLLTAEAGSEPSLLYFRARNGDPDTAAELANTWASLFVTRANQIYGQSNSEQLVFYQDQLADSKTRLDQAEQRLIDFQAENRMILVSNQLDALTTLQTDYLTNRNALGMLLDDIEAHQQQIATGTADPSQLSEQLTAMSLQSRAYGIQESLPVLLQLDAADFAGQSAQQSGAYLNALSTAVQDRVALYDQQLQDLEPQVLALQVDKQELLAQGTALQRDRDLLEETYTALTRKVDEEIITTQDTSSGFRLAGRASVPVHPSGGSPILLALIGLAFGMVLASLVVLVLAWWRS